MNTAKTKQRIRRSKEELVLEAKKYFRRVDFQKYSNAHYKQAWRKGLDFLDQICSHMEAEWKIKWEKIEQVQEEALKYTDRTTFARNSTGAYDKAQRMGWLDTVCAFMGEKSNEAYTNEEIEQEAKKYSSKSQFRNESPKIWGAAYKRDNYEDVCSHMDVLWKIKWDTFEKIHTEALKYKRPSEFKRLSSGAFDAALRLKILHQVCSHMEKKYGSSLKEYELIAAIQTTYPNAKKFKDRKVSIPGKDHIRGFEIDILVGDLGIEFDGTYWHSFERMRASRNRKHWSDGDIRNYHELKDSWFASKGIQILHIKEEDWDLDKEGCIQKCLNFLRGESVEQVA